MAPAADKGQRGRNGDRQRKQDGTDRTLRNRQARHGEARRNAPVRHRRPRARARDICSFRAFQGQKVQLTLLKGNSQHSSRSTDGYAILSLTGTLFAARQGMRTEVGLKKCPYFCPY